MSNNQSIGDSSEGLLTIVHPRSDWPQDGWISYQARTNVPSFFTAPPTQYEHSYRPPDRRIMQSNGRYFYYGEMSQPQWTSFAVPVTSYIVKNDWHIDTTRTISPRDAQRASRYELLPDAGEPWWTSFVPAITAYIAKNDWHIDTVRTTDRRVTPNPRLEWEAGFERLDWNTANLQPSTNPAVNDWHIDTVRTNDKRVPQRKAVLYPDAQEQWWATAAASFATIAAQDWHIDTVMTDTAITKRETYLLWPDAQEQWWTAFATLAAKVAAQDWHQDTTRTTRSAFVDRRLRQYDPDHAWIYTAVQSVPAFDPAFMAGITQLCSNMTEPQAKLALGLYADFYDLSWLHDVIPLTDPTTGKIHLRPIAPIMSARRRNRRRH